VRADGGAQLVECLPGKCEALNSNPTAPKTTQKTKNLLVIETLEFIYFCLFGFGSIGVWSQGVHSTTWTMSPDLLFPGYFGDIVFLFAWSSPDLNPPILGHCVWDEKNTTPWPPFFYSDGALQNFLAQGVLELPGAWDNRCIYWLRWGLENSPIWTDLEQTASHILGMTSPHHLVQPFNHWLR
jgi:hypothetical protein